MVGQVFGAGQGETFGQGVEQLAEFQAPQQRLELGGDLDGLGRGRCRAVRLAGLMRAS